MRLALLAVVGLTIALAATSAQAGACSRHGMTRGVGRVSLHRAFLPGEPDCVDKERIAERPARRATHGGFFEIHGRYQH